MKVPDLAQKSNKLGKDARTLKRNSLTVVPNPRVNGSAVPLEG